MLEPSQPGSHSCREELATGSSSVLCECSDVRMERSNCKRINAVMTTEREKQKVVAGIVDHKGKEDEI